MYILYISLTFILINSIICSASQKLNNTSISSKYKQTVTGTNITTDTYYCIKDSNGLFLAWDGNDGYGLLTNNLDNCYSSDSYQFQVLVNEDNSLSIKNKKTDRLLTFYSYFYLTNTTGSYYDNIVSIVVRDNGNVNIKSSSYAYYLGNAYAFIGSLGCYAITAQTSNAYIANWTFIEVRETIPEVPNSGLLLKVNAFKYESIDKDVLEENTNQLNLISPINVENNSSSKITQEIDFIESISESWNWNFDQNLTIFGSNITLIKKYPKFLSRSLKSMNSPKKYYYKQNEYKFESQYNIKKTVDINPDSKLRIVSYVDLVEDLVIKFNATGIITSVDNITGENIASIISKETNITIIETLEYSVITSISGELTATYVTNDYFKVIALDSSIE